MNHIFLGTIPSRNSFSSVIIFVRSCRSCSCMQYGGSIPYVNDDFSLSFGSSGCKVHNDPGVGVVDCRLSVILPRGRCFNFLFSSIVFLLNSTSMMIRLTLENCFSSCFVFQTKQTCCGNEFSSSSSCFSNNYLVQ